MTLRLRPALIADADALTAVFLAARRNAMSWLREVHIENETRWWVEHVVLDRAVVWVAEVDGAVVGFAAACGESLDHLYVVPAAQGRGVGSALLAKAQAASPGRLSLWVCARNARARSFYEARGFGEVEWTDGSGNEEREPDVRYAWRAGEG